MFRLYCLQKLAYLTWVTVTLKVALGWSASCTTVISVSSSHSETPCRPTYEDEFAFPCGSLQEAIDFAGAHQDGNCTEILLQPDKRYSVMSPIAANSSLVIRSSDPVSLACVSFNASRTPLPSYDYEPFYVLNLEYADYVRIERIEFSNSHGIVSILHVKTVEIIDCAFR